MSWGGSEKNRWINSTFQSVCSDRLLENGARVDKGTLNCLVDATLASVMKAGRCKRNKLSHSKEQTLYFDFKRMILFWLLKECMYSDLFNTSLSMGW